MPDRCLSAPPPRCVQPTKPAGQPPLKFMFPVGGIGFGSGGVGNGTACGSSTSPPSTVAPPAIVSALTLPPLPPPQAPTPVRGVDRVPWIAVVAPISFMFPLVPTFPP